MDYSNENKSIYKTLIQSLILFASN